jgi:hypothetical protein
MKKSFLKEFERRHNRPARLKSKKRKRWHNSLLALITLCIIPTTACVDDRAARVFDFDGGRLVARSTPEEVADGRALLEKVPIGVIPRGLEGSVVFDGRVVATLANDQHGQPAWLMSVDHAYVGMSELSSTKVTIRSATVQNGGAVLKTGREYRAMAVNFDGSFYTWSAVVLDLPDRR